MAWLENLSRVTHPDGRQLIGASFRGVPFFVEDSDRQGGRRTAKHQFVDGDTPKLDDLGKMGNEFQVRGYVIGDEYMAQRDQLLSALQDVAGPGDLVHPFYGHVRVQVGGVGIRESQSDGGTAQFSISFSHAPVSSAPVAVIDLDAELVGFAALVITTNSDNLEDSAVVIAQPAFALESLSQDLTDVSTALYDALSPFVTATQEAALLSVSIDTLTLQAATLVRTPADMLEEFGTAISQLTESIENAPLEIVKALVEAYETPAPALAIGDTDARVQERLNQALFADALRTVLISEAARIIIGVDFPSIGDATETRNLIVGALDELASTAGNEMFPVIVNLRSGILRAIPGDRILASAQVVERHTDIPSILLSYQLYGNTDSAADLAARNRVQHPGYMSGSLDVLLDV